MLYFLLTVIIVGLAMTVMGVGLMFSNRCLRGSCGGPDGLGPDGESLSCGACANRKEKVYDEGKAPRV